MRASEITAAGELGGEALAGGIELIRAFHAGIASRPFRALGLSAEPVRRIHDGVSTAVYAGVSGSLRALVHGGARARAATATETEPELASRPVASIVLGALNGIGGDRLERDQHGFAIRMAMKAAGTPLLTDPAALAAAVGAPSGRLAVFVHGLCETEAAWWLPARKTAPEDRRVYGEVLEHELGFTSVYLRYNTGRHISGNGRELAHNLQALVDVWPVPVSEIVLVGHSMGGLVARSAAHHAAADAPTNAWTDRLTHVFCLGTPHLGADLEKGANALSWALRKLPETRPLSTVLNSRSSGIKDLRYGSCLDEDWSDCDPDELLRDRCGEVPFLPHTTYYFIGAALSPGPVGRLLGDLLVRMPSASGAGSGRGRRIPFEVENGSELHGLTHFDLLGHPAVLQQLQLWIAAGPRLDQPRAASHSASARPSSVTGGSS